MTSSNPARPGAARRGAARRACALLCALAMSLCAAAVAAASESSPAASAGDVTIAPVRDKSDIWKRWEALRPKFEGDNYAEPPSVVQPFAAGKLADGFLADGLNMLNYMRYIAGLEADVSFTDELLSRAQRGAVLLESSGFSHAPAQPAGMADDFYESALNSVGASNISTGFSNLPDFVRAVMSDSDASNIDRLGHRRWVLNPKMQHTGFGFAEGGLTQAGGSAVMQALDESRAGASPSLVAWPAAGYHPLNAFNTNDAWCLILDPAAYDAAKTGDIRVTLSGAGGAQEFGPQDKDANGKYFNVDTAGYGAGFCVIFRPMLAYKNGDRFDVTVSGVYPVGAAAPVRVRYQVEFAVQEGFIQLQIGSNEIVVNGVSQKIDDFGTKALIVDGRTLVPIRAVAEAMGGTVGWDEADKKVTIRSGGKVIELWIGMKSARVDGEGRTLDIAPQIINERTMLPVRFVTESLGADVTWEEAEQKVGIRYVMP